MDIYFVSSNEQKAKEVMTILNLPDKYQVHHENVTTDKIQSDDMKKIAENKAMQAFEKVRRPTFVEHTGLFIDDFGNLPGGFTKIFLDSLGEERFGEIFSKIGSAKVTAKTIIAFCDGKQIQTFEGSDNGKIIYPPRGETEISFGWDGIFVPSGSEETYAEMKAKGQVVPMRKEALETFEKYLEKYEFKDSVPETSDVFKDIDPKNTILFVGAGVSATVGLPTWSDLISQIASQLGYDQEFFKQYGDNLTLAEFYAIKENGIGKLKDWLEKNWTVLDEKIESSSIYKTIVELGFPLVYTTNYDSCLEQAWKLFGKKYKKIVGVDDLVDLDPNATQIVKFHGDIAPESPVESIVLTESSYFERLEFESPLDIKLRADMLGKSILFIGYGLSDINMRMILYKLDQLWKKGNAGKRPKSYIFLPQPNPIQEKIFAERNITPIIGESIDKTESLEKFLKKLFTTHSERDNITRYEN